MEGLRMKVLCGEFITESNANIPEKCNIRCYDIAFGDQCVDKMRVRKVLEENGIEPIGSIYANAAANGVITKSTFDYIESAFVSSVRDHLSEIDGILLLLHGASEVEGLGSGDHHIMKKIREITGPYLPVAVVCDPHGNLTKEYAESIQILRSYRESPHTDADESMWKVAQMLCDLLKDRQNIHSVYRKLPLILGGEQSVSADEPVKSINAYMDEMEKDPRIRSASWHVGYIRHDCDCAGCAVVVVPKKGEDQAYAELKADELAKYVWDRRHEFHYTGTTAKPDEALKMVLDCDGLAFLTDSGDNVTSGATGWNTYVLRQVLTLKNLRKSFLFATITDPVTYKQLEPLQPGQEAEISLGMGYDELSKPVKLKVTVKSHGDIFGFMMHDHNRTFGSFVRVNVIETPIDIMVSSTNFATCEKEQFDKTGIDLNSYDVVVVKEGYIFPDFEKMGKLCVMSLTEGATLQDTARLPFKRIMRPMYPIDQI